MNNAKNDAIEPDKYIYTKLDGFTLRFAGEQDVPLILYFIRELAIYEKQLDRVTATEELLKESIFGRKAAEVVIGEFEGRPVGFALFFHNFSTFLGKPGIYLEDLFILPDMRGKGMGRIMLSFLAKTALERNCGRLEWWCLDWNEPAVRFYRQMGAEPMDEWTVFRVCDDALVKLGDNT